MVAVAGVWDWILYFSPLKNRLTPYKFNKTCVWGAWCVGVSASFGGRRVAVPAPRLRGC